MKDAEAKIQWLQSYPVGTEVEVHYGRRGWIAATVTEQLVEPMTVLVKCITDPPDPTTLYTLYGSRKEIRRR